MITAILPCTLSPQFINTNPIIMVLGDDQTPESIRIIIKGLFVEVMPSPNNVARDRSFLQRHFDSQNYFHFPFRS